MTRKAIKESEIADHLANHTVEHYEPLNFDLPDEDVPIIENDNEESDWWTLHFDGAVKILGNRAGVVIISLEKKQYPITLELKVKKLEVFGDSLLIICQVKG
jgi:hypothetical protein